MSGLSGIGIVWAFSSCISSVVVCVGYFMPYWISGEIYFQFNGKSEQKTPVYFGIFRRCNYPAINNEGELTMVLECGKYTTFSDIPSLSWKISTIVIGFACGICLLVSLTSMFGICVKSVIVPTVARTSGILQMCSALLMATGVGIYPHGWSSPEVQQACGDTSKSYDLGNCSLSWCFYMTSVGIGVTLICSTLAFHAPKLKQIITGHAL